MSWAGALRQHARLHTPAALGLGLGLLAVAGLLGQSLVQFAIGNAAPGLRLALLGGAAGFAATALGALPALVLRSLPQRVEDTMLGLAAGMMLAASAFSLLLPGLAAGGEILGGKALGAAVVVAGMALGVLLMLGLDTFTPHEHDKTGGALVIGFIDRASALGREYEAHRAENVFYRDARFHSGDEVERLLGETGFGAPVWAQTLFRPPPEILEIEPLRAGRGEGSFAVVRAALA